MERAAVARLRWIRDPDGDPEASLRAWPAMRTFGLALMVQVLAMQLLGLAGVTGAPGLVLGYVAFAAVMLEVCWRAWRRQDVAPRWEPRAQRRGELSARRRELQGWVCSTPASRSRSGARRAAPSRRQCVGDGALATRAGALRGAAGALSEGLFFRGWLQQALRRDLPTSPSSAPVAALAAAAFAVMHVGAAWLLFAAGGPRRGRRRLAHGGRVETSAVMHVTSNALVMYAALSA
ncbi:MAG: CPBP family glutamic-type intramembrane protease [Polyangiales bacterium]